MGSSAVVCDSPPCFDFCAAKKAQFFESPHAVTSSTPSVTTTQHPPHYPAVEPQNTTTYEAATLRVLSIVLHARHPDYDAAIGAISVDPEHKPSLRW